MMSGHAPQNVIKDAGGCVHPSLLPPELQSWHRSCALSFPLLSVPFGFLISLRLGPPLPTAGAALPLLTLHNFLHTQALEGLRAQIGSEF